MPLRSDGPEFYTSLREMRLAKDLSQAQLAELVGVSRQTINYIEVGTYIPTTKLALQLARALGTKVEKLFMLKD